MGIGFTITTCDLTTDRISARTQGKRVRVKPVVGSGSGSPVYPRREMFECRPALFRLGPRLPRPYRIAHDRFTIDVTCVGIDRVTVEVDGVPHQSVVVVDGQARLDATTTPDQHLVEIVGYHNTIIRQRHRLSA